MIIILSTGGVSLKRTEIERNHCIFSEQNSLSTS